MMRTGAASRPVATPKTTRTQTRVTTRLAPGFGIVLAMLVALSVVGMSGMTRIRDKLDEIVHVHNAETMRATNLRDAVSGIAIAIRNMAVMTNDGDVRAEVGHRFTLDMGQWGLQPCMVITVESERLLSYSFAPGMLDTTITWRLAAEESGTRLSLEHKGFDLDSPPGKAAFHGMGGGWPAVLARLEGTLAEA